MSISCEIWFIQCVFFIPFQCIIIKNLIAIIRGNFNSKWAFLTQIQIQCHHVLANEIDLNLKYRIGLKQFFNINLGIGMIKKILFLFLFSTYIPLFLLKFWSRELVGCGIKFCIQWVPTQNTFDGPRYPKKKEIPEKMWWWCHHHVSLGISCFSGSRVCQKYAEWLLLGCRI